jgi:hypothetical protein
MRSRAATRPAGRHHRLGGGSIPTLQALMQPVAFIAPAAAEERVDGD